MDIIDLPKFFQCEAFKKLKILRFIYKATLNYALPVIITVTFSGCHGSSTQKTEDGPSIPSFTIPGFKEEEIRAAEAAAADLPSFSYDDLYINSVRGHDERDTIVGNFTGNGLDTIFVFQVKNKQADDCDQYISYYAKSTNPKIPSVKLYGCDDEPPRLVYEGDVDRNGRDEWGYLHTWMTSQWRAYRIYTLVDNEWRFLIDEDNELLDTSLNFRGSGYDIVEKGNRRGYVKINYMNESLVDTIVHDTIIAATYRRIKER